MAALWNWLFPAPSEEEQELCDVTGMGTFELDAAVADNKYAVLEVAVDVPSDDLDAWYALLAAVRAIAQDVDRCMAVVVTTSHVVAVLDGCACTTSEVAYLAGRLNAAMALATGKGVAIQSATAMGVPRDDAGLLLDYLGEVCATAAVNRARVVKDDAVKAVPECWLDDARKRDDEWVLA